MNYEFALNLQDLETLLTKSNCSCHFINPNKTRILLWREVKADQTTYHLRIGIQKFSSQEQIDRNGEIYWRFGSYELKMEEESQPASQKEEIKEEMPPEEPTKSELDPIAKFQQRQAKTASLNHERNSENS